MMITDMTLYESWNNLYCVASHRIASHRIASHRIASHRIASHRIASRRVASRRIASHRVASHRIASHRIASRRVASRRGASHRIASHRIASYCKLCRHRSQECLDNHLLTLADGTTRYAVPIGIMHDVQVKLPAGLTCNKCMFQWKYHAGESRDSQVTVTLKKTGDSTDWILGWVFDRTVERRNMSSKNGQTNHGLNQ